MELDKTDEAVSQAREWSIDRMDNGNLSYEDQSALFAEFEEWIDLEHENHLEVLALEPIEKIED